MTKFKRLIIFAYLSYLVLFTLAEIGEVLWLFAYHNLAIIHSNLVGPTDFLGFYLAGQVAASPQRAFIYDTNAYKNLFESATNCALGSIDMRLSHLPFVPLIMAPFSYLPIDLAHLLFALSTTIFGLFSFFLLIRQTNSDNKSFTPLLLLGIVSSSPCWRNWAQGQIMWLDAGLLALFIAYFFAQKNIKAGLTLALSSLKPQYAIYLALPAFACKRYWLLFYAVITEIILAIVCYTAYGQQALQNYIQSFNAHEVTSIFTKALDMNCLRPFLCQFLSQADAYKISIIINLGILISATLICFLVAKNSQNKQTLCWLFSSLILTALLFSPHAHLHDTILIAIPAILTLPSLLGTDKLSPTLFIWKWFFYLFPIISWLCYWLWILAGIGNYLLTIIIAILLFCALRQVFLQSKNNALLPPNSPQTHSA